MKKRKAHDFHGALMSSALAGLKKEFRKWYGVISIREFASNRELMEEIARFEKRLVVEGAWFAKT